MRIVLKTTTKGTYAPGLTELRLAVLGIVSSIALTVAFGVPGSWWCKLIAGVLSFVLACGLIRIRRTQRWLMRLADIVMGYPLDERARPEVETQSEPS